MPGIEDTKEEHKKILEQLSDPELISNWGAFEDLSKRKLHLERILAKFAEVEEVKEKIKENQSLISANEDPELMSLAEADLVQLIERQKILEQEIADLEKNDFAEESENTNSDQKQYSAVIVEIRAGTGGDEAALFASDLFRMYSRFPALEGWKSEVLDSKSTNIGGVKEITFEMSPASSQRGENGNVLFKMKYEGGVHRVQRIPSTEKSGRIHTSTATVAVLAKPKKSEIKIKPDDLRIDFYRASGPGGQYVNKRETAVRITHLPSGIVVTSQTERNQLKNKENALSILEAKILEKKQIEEEESMAGKRKDQVGWAKRSEKIRTYNFPQDRLTDHRIKKSWHNLAKILDGDLSQVVKSLKKADA